MPATVSISHIGNPEVSGTVGAAIEDFFKRYSGNWGVTVIGAQDNDVWELRVEAPDGQKNWKHNLHGHDRAHNADAIIDALKGITSGYPSKK